MSAVVFKIMTATHWRRAQGEGLYHGSPDDIRDGFIHLSTAEQAPATLAKHFATVPDDLVLLRINTAVIEPHLRWEESRGGALFPHLYSVLRASEVEAVFPVERDHEGNLIPPAL